MIAKLHAGKYHDYIALDHYEPKIGWFGHIITDNGDVYSYLVWKPHFEITPYNCWTTIPCLRGLPSDKSKVVEIIYTVCKQCPHNDISCTSPV